MWTALSNGDGTFQPPRFVLADFGFEGGGWRVEKHPRLLADLTGTGRAAIVGFGDAGVYVALSNRDGTFEAPPRFVLANFGYEITVLAIVRSDREFQDSGIWRSSDRGRNWTRVHAFPPGAAGPPAAGQLVWAPGTGHIVLAAGSTALAVSRDGGATFQNAMPLVGGSFQMVNHVAVAATPPGTLNPPAVYAIVNSFVFVSFDGGFNWITRPGQRARQCRRRGEPAGRPGRKRDGRVAAFGPHGLRDRERTVPRRPSSGAGTTEASRPPTPCLVGACWFSLRRPRTSPIGRFATAATCSSLTTPPGRGDLLFFNPIRTNAYVGPLDPRDEDDWRELDRNHTVHVDLHGMWLSADFEASFEDGYPGHDPEPSGCSSDGGIFRSTRRRADLRAGLAQHQEPVVREHRRCGPAGTRGRRFP